MRTIFIGDIHGCSGSLHALLEKVKPEAGKDRLVLLGDLFDRGPDSYGVYETVKQLANSFGENFILLLGNHEDYLLQPFLTRWQKMVWERVGRQATVDSFLRSGMQMEDTIPWLKEHARLCWKSEEFQCVHAGLLIDPPEANDLQTLVHDHEIALSNRYNGPLTVTGHIALDNVTWFAGDGETTAEIEEGKNLLIPKQGILCIDTGCGKGGRLTAMIAEGGWFELKSVPEQ